MCFAFIRQKNLIKTKNADQVAKSWGTVGNCITCVVGEDDVWQEYRMRFTYFAGRYFAVEKSSEAVEVNDITGEAISSAWKTNGTFQCDDSRYVQIYDLVEKRLKQIWSVYTQTVLRLSGLHGRSRIT